MGGGVAQGERGRDAILSRARRNLAFDKERKHRCDALSKEEGRINKAQKRKRTEEKESNRIGISCKIGAGSETGSTVTPKGPGKFAAGPGPGPHKPVVNEPIRTQSQSRPGHRHYYIYLYLFTLHFNVHLTLDTSDQFLV